MSNHDCIFCAIASGSIPAEIVETSDNVIAFRDMAPKAPLHVLIVPREHHRDVVEMSDANPLLLSEMAMLAGRVAAVQSHGDFRWVFNTGPSAGQTVFHVHGHVLGGHHLEWDNA